jgi:hypothetical protein
LTVYEPEVSVEMSSSELHRIDADLQSVTFSGPGLITIEADPGDPAYPDPPHWLDTDTSGYIDQPGEHALPVGYSRGDIPVVSAVFKVNYLPSDPLPPGIELATPMVRGDGPGETDIPETAATISQTSEGTFLTLSATAMTNPIADAVAYFRAFEIEWYVSSLKYVGGETRIWDQAGKSSNEMYVTWAAPTLSGPIYHTVIHVPTVASIGATATTAIINFTWNKFATREVYKANPAVGPPQPGEDRRLYYYKSWRIVSHTTEALLRQGDGQCDAWANYFADCLGAIGITLPEKPYVKFSPGLGDGFMIKNAGHCAGGEQSPEPNYPYFNEFTTYLDRWYNSTRYVWGDVAGQNVDIHDGDGVSGQGTANPLSTFANHVLVKLNGTYYDPSYGLTYANLQAFDDNIAYFYRGPRYIQIGLSHIYFRDNPPGVQVNETESSTLAFPI